MKSYCWNISFTGNSFTKCVHIPFAGCSLRSEIYFIRLEDLESIFLATTTACLYKEVENKTTLFKKYNKSPIISDLGGCLWADLRCKQISAN